VSLEVYANPEVADGGVGTISITFSELPVAGWQSLSNEEKRARGVSNGAGVSVVRGGREVDYGWFFMGSKRRENYDDWWRCEIRFDPILDEAFGITHTKQQVRPRDHLLEAIQPHVEATAKALNNRVRQAHTQTKAGKLSATAESIAEEKHALLKPIPRQSILAQDTRPLRDLSRRHAGLKGQRVDSNTNNVRYRLIEDAGGGSEFFTPMVSGGIVLGALNPKHRFFSELYAPLLEARSNEAERASRALQLLLLAAARAEAMFTRRDEQAAVARFRKEWSDVLNTLLKDAR